MFKVILVSLFFLLATNLVLAQGSALEFDGGDYVDLPASSSIVTDSPFTISAWIKTSVQQGEYDEEGRIVNTHRVDAGSYSTAGAIYAGGATGYTRNAICFLYCTTDAGAHSWLAYDTPSPYYWDDEWHHIAATHDGTTARLYYDGVQVAFENNSFGTFGTATGKIGSFDGSSRYFVGTIEEARIWDVALTQTQIDDMNNIELYDDNTASGVAWSNLMGYWKLNDGSGPTATDSSDSGGNGTLATSPATPSWVTSDAPLPIILSFFSSEFISKKLTLKWATQSEIDNSYWNIYRSPSVNLGQAKKINPDPIEGGGTTFEPTYYSFQDEYEYEVGETFYYWLESVDLAGITVLYGSMEVKKPANENPGPPIITDKYGLFANYPNPFNPSTTIYFRLKETTTGSVNVFNLKGKKIKTLFDGDIGAEEILRVTWNGTNSYDNATASGFYFIQLKTKDKTYTRRVMLLK